MLKQWFYGILMPCLAFSGDLIIQHGVTGRVESITFPQGQQVHYTYDANQNLRYKTLSRFKNQSLNGKLTSNQSEFHGMHVLNEFFKPIEKVNLNLLKLTQTTLAGKPREQLEVIQKIWARQAANTLIAVDGPSVVQLIDRRINEMFIPLKQNSKNDTNLMSVLYNNAIALKKKEILAKQPKLARQTLALTLSTSSPAIKKVYQYFEQRVFNVSKCNLVIGNDLKSILLNQKLIYDVELNSTFLKLDQYLKNIGNLSVKIGNKLMIVKQSTNPFYTGKIELLEPVIYDAFLPEKQSIYVQGIQNNQNDLEFKKEYFGSANFNYMKFKYPFREFWLVHELGHLRQDAISQASTLQQFELSTLQRVHDNHIPLPKSLKSKFEHLYDELQFLTETSATYFALDVLAPCT